MAPHHRRAPLVVVLPLLLVLLPVLAAADPGWPVGWGFAKGGGFPPLPAGWAAAGYGGTLRDASVGFFLGNATGLDSPAELRAEVRFGVVGIGWQINNVPSHHSHLESFELETAAALKATRPGVRVMVTRESEATTTLYDGARAKMMDPKCADWWVQCGGAPCNGTWNSPAGNTPKYFFNFSNPDMADWWVNEFVGGVLKSPHVDGVYFDSAPVAGPPQDGGGQGGGPGRADAQAAFDRALKLIASHGGWASAWNNDGQSLFPEGMEPDAHDYSLDACSSLVREWIDIGRNTDRTLQVQTGTDTPRNETLAAFLIARGESAVLEFPISGTYGDASVYGFPAIMDVDFGTPMGDGIEVHPEVFRREWSKATVTLDCRDLSSTFDFHQDDGGSGDGQ